MKYLFQFGVIMLFVALGDVVAALIPLPIAGSIYGMLLLFGALACKLIRLEWVADVADWLHSIMGLFFVAPAAAIITIWGDISAVWWRLLILLVLTYLVSMITTGVTAQALIDKSTSRNRGADAK